MRSPDTLSIFRPALSLRRTFSPDHARYDGVRPVNIYLLRLLYGLTFFVIGSETWTYIFTHQGPWDHVRAVAYCVWASYATLSFLGLFYPLRMLPLVMFQISYKVVWLLLIAYPLWSSGQLSGSPAEQMTYAYLWVVLPIVAMPWGHFVRTYVWRGGRARTAATIGSATVPAGRPD